MSTQNKGLSGPTTKERPLIIIFALPNQETEQNNKIKFSFTFTLESSKPHRTFADSIQAEFN